ncbi:MAG: hypothetical protein IJX39_08940 [Clostridia bacterium]|nr:hypothetical protein [Clostridia bacterium]
MRKFLAALLAVMMLVGVLAVLPVSAADAEPLKATFDGTTSDYEGPLVITEILVDSKSGSDKLDDQVPEGEAAVWKSADAFDYIEVYNRSTEPIDLYDYAFVAAKSSTFKNDGLFTHYVKLKAYDIFDGMATGVQTSYEECYNPGEAQLAPGAFAVIWFWNGDTTKLCNELKKSVGDNTGEFTYFKEYYGAYGMPEDTLVLAVCGKGSYANGSAIAPFALAAGWTYALVDESTSNYDFGKAVYDTKGDGTKALSSEGQKIAYMAEYVTGNAVGILTTEGMDNMSAYYVPSNVKPDLKIEDTLNTLVVYPEVAEGATEPTAEAIAKAKEETEKAQAEYLASAKCPVDYLHADHARSYREVAIATFTENPGPGSMPAWQWMYVDPVGATHTSTGDAHGLAALEAKAWTAANGDMNAYNTAMAKIVYDWKTRTKSTAGQATLETLVTENTKIKDSNGRLIIADANEDGKADWISVCLTEYLAERATPAEDIKSNDETKINYRDNFVSRDVLQERNADKTKTKNNTKSGLPVWALILIIVGGVVVVGGGVTVAIILIKKKNKPVAADDVAAEGEVQVIDETADGAEAPAEEAAPTEEDKE